MTDAVQCGVCRYCGCSEAAPCWHCRAHHDGCIWTTKEQIVCAGSDCIVAEEERLAALRKPDPYRNWGLGAIAMKKRQLKKNARARARAARKRQKRRAA